MKGQIKEIQKAHMKISGNEIITLLKQQGTIPENTSKVAISFRIPYSGMSLFIGEEELLDVHYEVVTSRDWECTPKWEIDSSLYAVTSSPEGELGDIFYGTLAQFRDCFCGNVIRNFEELKFHAKGIHGNDVIVSKVDQ